MKDTPGGTANFVSYYAQMFEVELLEAQAEIKGAEIDPKC
jgi:hypothetical protein